MSTCKTVYVLPIFFISKSRIDLQIFLSRTTWNKSDIDRPHQVETFYVFAVGRFYIFYLFTAYKSESSKRMIYNQSVH